MKRESTSSFILRAKNWDGGTRFCYRVDPVTLNDLRQVKGNTGMKKVHVEPPKMHKAVTAVETNFFSHLSSNYSPFKRVSECNY